MLCYYGEGMKEYRKLCRREGRSAFKILTGKLTGKRPIERARRRREVC